MTTLLLEAFVTGILCVIAVVAYRKIPWMSQPWRVVITPTRNYYDRSDSPARVRMYLVKRFHIDYERIFIGEVKLDDDYYENFLELKSKAQDTRNMLINAKKRRWKLNA